MVNTLEEIIKSKIDNIDMDYIVKECVEEIIHKNMDKLIMSKVSTYINEAIESEFERQMTMPLSTDDGWGKKTNYGSFEELFRSEFKKKMNESWEVKRTIEKMVSEKVAALYQQNAKEVINAIANNIIKEAK